MSASVAPETPAQNPTDLADRIQALAKGFQAVLDIGAYLRDIGSIDQATAEAIARRDKALGDRDTVVEQIAASKAELTDTLGQITVAQDRATKIVNFATATAAKIVDDAGQEADRKTAAGNKVAMDLKITIRDLTVERDAVSADLKAAQAELATTQAKIAEVTAQARTALGL